MNNQDKKTKKLLNDILPMTIAQIAVIALTCLGALVLVLVGVTDKFDIRVLFGSMLGERFIEIQRLV